MELKYGRPESTDGRSEVELACYDLLDSLGIDYGRVDHPAAMTMEDCLEADGVLGVNMCKNLFLCNRQKTEFYLLLIPGDKAFKTKFFSAALGIARVSFADAEDMTRLLGVTPGSVSIMGLMNDKNGEVTLVIDREVANEEYLGCHPCANTSSMKISFKDVTEKLIPAMGHEPVYIDLTTEE